MVWPVTVASAATVVSVAAVRRTRVRVWLAVMPVTVARVALVVRAARASAVRVPRAPVVTAATPELAVTVVTARPV
jgi:hypothetical protein